MLALRRRSKSRGRSKDRARERMKKKESRESGIPTVITVCNDNTEDADKIQIQPVARHARRRRRSKDRDRSAGESEEFSTDDEMLLEYRNEGNEGTGKMPRRRSGSRPLGLSSDDEDTGGAVRRRSGTKSSGLSNGSLLPSSEHTGTRSKASAKKDRSNSLKISRKLSRSFSDSDRSLEADETVEELHNEETHNQLREKLMKECMGAIERRQKQARQLISVDEQRLRKDFDNLLKQSIKQQVTRSQSDELKSNMLTTMSEHRGSNKTKRRTSTSDISQKNRTIIDMFDVDDDSSFETELPLQFQQDKGKLKRSKASTKSNRSNSLKSTVSLSVSSKSELTLGDKHNEKKGESKPSSNNTQITNTKENDGQSKIPPPPTSTPVPNKHKSEKSKKSSNPKKERKLSTTTMTETMTDDTSHHYLLELEPANRDKKTSPNLSDWRKRVSNFITAGRSRSKSKSRSKSNDRSKAKSKSRSRSRNRTRSRDRTISKSGSWGARGKSGNKTDNSSKFGTSKASSEQFSVDDDGTDMKWHNLILKHNWDDFRNMLKSYDHTKYRQRSNGSGKPRSQQDSQEVSPLLQVDTNGRTPLHLACKEQMPSRLLRRLLFVERNAAYVQDADGRYPLHLAIIYNLDEHILDRVIHANPDSLVAPDNLKHTPIQYAVLKADRRRENKEIKWGPPQTEEQDEIQKLLIDAYQPVLFILESMAKRHKILSVAHEKKTLIEAVGNFAPPEVVDLMVILSEKILQKSQKMSERLMRSVFEQNYPLNVIHRVLEITSKVIPSADLLETIRQRLTVHFNEGCKGDTSLAKKFAKTCRKGGKKIDKTSSVCRDWWEKLRYLIARSCNRTSNWKNDTVLHMALCNPKSQPSLIEYLCRLNSAAKYKLDEVTGALPIHLAFIHWHPDKYGLGDERAQVKVLNLLLAGDFDLVRKGSADGRIALHYAILHGRPMSCIQVLLNLDEETLSIRDPVTNLLPFQLAATVKKSKAEKPTQQVDVIYNLLRASPF